MTGPGCVSRVGAAPPHLKPVPPPSSSGLPLPPGGLACHSGLTSRTCLAPGPHAPPRPGSIRCVPPALCTRSAGVGVWKPRPGAGAPASASTAALRGDRRGGGCGPRGGAGPLARLVASRFPPGPALSPPPGLTSLRDRLESRRPRQAPALLSALASSALVGLRGRRAAGRAGAGGVGGRRGLRGDQRDGEARAQGPAERADSGARPEHRGAGRIQAAR